MSEIPEDIIETARRAWPTAREDGVAIHMTIARAILAERQRCADVAEGFRQAHDTGSGFDSQPARATAEAIKEIILKPQ